MLKQPDIRSLRQLLRLGSTFCEARVSSGIIQTHETACQCLSCSKVSSSAGVLSQAQAREYSTRDNPPRGDEAAPSTSKSIHEGETSGRQ